MTPPESATFRFLHQPTNPMSVGPLANNAVNDRESMSHICYACINGYLPHRIFEAFLEIFTTLLRLCGFLGHSSKMGALADVNTHTLQLCKLWIVKAGDTKSCIVYLSC